MKKILLVNPSYRNSYANSFGSVVNPVFPVLSLASLSAVAHELDIQCEILDLCFEDYDSHAFIKKILDRKPNMVGFTVLTPSMNQVRDLSIGIKAENKNILLFAGGPHVSALPQKSLEQSQLDLIIVGEGEETFREVLQGKDWSLIKGLCFRKRNSLIVGTGEREKISNLDDLPMPSWESFDLNVYRNKTSPLFAKKHPFVSVEFSRGCIYRCDFCASKNTMHFGYRKKSPKRCAKEIARLRDLGVREFMLTDDIFTTDKEWAKEVCRELISLNSGLIWSCTNGIRVESADEELFRLMKKAGCYRIAFGFESGSEKVLKAFGKGGKASLENAKRAVKLANEVGLEVMGFFMVGLTGDTRDSIKETIQFAKSLNLTLFKFGVTIAFPGTQMFSRLLSKNLIRSFDWDKYHIYTSENLFVHETLSSDEIQKMIRKAYIETTFLSPRFIFKKFIETVVNFNWILNFKIFLKLIFSKSTQDNYEVTYYFLDLEEKTDFESIRCDEIRLKIS